MSRFFHLIKTFKVSFFNNSKKSAKNDSTYNSKSVVPQILDQAPEIVDDLCCEKCSNLVKKWRDAQGGNASDQNFIGACYLHSEGVKQIPNKAVYWLHKSAQQDFIKGQTNLGYCYLQGIGVEKNGSLGNYWTYVAAVMGSCIAQNNYAINLRTGFGVNKNESEAILWYQRGICARNISAYADLCHLQKHHPTPTENSVWNFCVDGHIKNFH